jgi:hypothetical protein
VVAVVVELACLRVGLEGMLNAQSLLPRWQLAS